MKRPAIVAIALLISAQAFAATKPLAPGTYSVPPCPETVPCVCSVDTVCHDVLAERNRLQAVLTTPRECPPAVEPARSSLQPDSANLPSGGTDAAPARLEYAPTQKVADWSPRGWRFWASVGGGIVLGAILENQWDDDNPSTHTTKHKTVIVEQPPEPCHGPPGWCRNH